MKDGLELGAVLSESVDTQGWDTVSAVRLETLNAAIAEAGTSPKAFQQMAEGAKVCAKFLPWRVSPDSDGRILSLAIDLKDLRIDESGDVRKYESAQAVVDVYLDLLPHDVCEDTGVTRCLLVVDLTPQAGESQAARVTSARIDGRHSLDDLAYFRIGLDGWLNAHLHAFTHVFAAVNIHHDVDANADFRWLKPSRVGYAFGYDQTNPDQSIMAVLCKTDGRTEEGLPYQVDVETLPQGMAVSYLLSGDLFFKDMLKGSVIRSFDGMSDSDLKFSHDDTVMELVGPVELKDIEYEGDTYDLVLEEFRLTRRETDFRVETLAASRVFPGIWSVVHSAAAYGIRMITNRAGQKTLGYFETEEMTTEKTQRVTTGMKVLEWMLIIVAAICTIVLGVVTFGVGSIIPTVLAGVIIGCGIASLSIATIEAVNDGNGPSIDLLVLNATEAITWSTGSRFIPREVRLNGALSFAGDFETEKLLDGASNKARDFQREFAKTMAQRGIEAA